MIRGHSRSDEQLVFSLSPPPNSGPIIDPAASLHSASFCSDLPRSRSWSKSTGGRPAYGHMGPCACVRVVLLMDGTSGLQDKNVNSKGDLWCRTLWASHYILMKCFCSFVSFMSTTATVCVGVHVTLLMHVCVCVFAHAHRWSPAYICLEGLCGIYVALIANLSYLCVHSQTFQVRIIDDEEYEKHENFFIVLEEPRWLKRGISGWLIWQLDNNDYVVKLFQALIKTQHVHSATSC